MHSMTTAGPGGRRRSGSGATLVQFNVNDRYNQSDQTDSAIGRLDAFAQRRIGHERMRADITARVANDLPQVPANVRDSRSEFDRVAFMESTPDSTALTQTK